MVSWKLWGLYYLGGYGLCFTAAMDSLTDAAIARLFTVGFHGTSPSRELEALLDRGVGGVILFARNVDTPEQVLDLTRSIKRRAGRPVFVGVDQEGGRVRRLRSGFTDVPAMRSLGLTGDAALARGVGQLLGRELRAVGIDVNFAPVVDVDTNPNNPVIGDRSLNSEAGVVAELGAALVEGLQGAGVAACAKHFPGHGDTEQDSHATLPRLAHGLERIERVELVPFARVVDAGVASIMTAHVLIDALDAEHPATLSQAVLSDLLRRRSRFDGVVFSDDLEMAAIAGRCEPGVAAVRALQAGVDNLLVCHSSIVAHAMIDAVAGAVRDGTLPEARVREAARRGAALSQRFAAPPQVSSDLSILACEEHRRLVERIRRGTQGASELAADPTDYARRGDA